MIKRVLFLMALTVLNLSPAFSAVSPSDLAKRQKEISDSLANLNVQRDNLKKTVSASETELGGYHQTFKNAENDWKEDAGGFWGFFRGKGSAKKPALDSARDAYEAAKGRIQPELTRAKTDLDRVGTQIIAQESDLSSMKEQTEFQLANLRSQIKRLSLTSDFNELSHRFDNMGDNLNEIESIYDKAMIGTYIQDKMGQLLNSNVLCVAANANRCNKKQEDRYEIKPEELQEIFPASSKDNRRSTYKKQKVTN
jgi:predicted  nucleic acid-binding Zn-ribbon protein